MLYVVTYLKNINRFIKRSEATSTEHPVPTFLCVIKWAAIIIKIIRFKMNNQIKEIRAALLGRTLGTLLPCNQAFSAYASPGCAFYALT